MPIRIESNLPHGLTVPYASAPGRKPKYFTIPGATPPVHATATTPGQPAAPGVVVLPELDSVTLARLKYHYEQRPADASQPDGNQIVVGLLKITITDDDGRPVTPNAPRPRPRRPSRGGKSAA